MSKFMALASGNAFCRVETQHIYIYQIGISMVLIYTMQMTNIGKQETIPVVEQNWLNSFVVLLFCFCLDSLQIFLLSKILNLVMNLGFFRGEWKRFYFVGFGRQKDHDILQRCAVSAIIWRIWMERNERIFNYHLLLKKLLCDRICFLASLQCHDFEGTSLADIQMDWSALLF